MGRSDQQSPGQVRLAILDDSPFVRTAAGQTHPVDATFHRFAEAVVRLGPFGRARYLVPVRRQADDASPPEQPPVDDSLLEVVPTASFGGIAGYLRRLPSITVRNWPILRSEAARADLCWIKVPASNALLMAVACQRARTARFAYVVGSTREVVRAQRRTRLDKVAAVAAATAYDGATLALQATGPAIVLDDEIFTSVIRDSDVTAISAAARFRPPGGPLRLVWAGRMAREKRLDDLVRAVARLRADGLEVELDLVGNGPERARLERSAREAGLDGSVRCLGYIGDRTKYFEALRRADIFVSPSRAEGIPKALVEAMAAGVPVIATPAGGVERLLDGGRRGRLAAAGSPEALARTIRQLAEDEPGRSEMRATALRWVSGRTADAQAGRLLAWLAETFPALPWDGQRPG